MTIYTFDFDDIADQQDFYREFSQSFAQPRAGEQSGLTVEAVTGGLLPPLEIEFIHLSDSSVGALAP